MALVVALLAGLGGVGVIVFAGAWDPAPPVKRSPAAADTFGRLLAPAVAAIVGAALALVVTGWIVAGIAGGLVGFTAVRGWRSRGSGGRREQERITALATWCEQLRDLMSADHGIIGTISTTAKTCPEPIRPEVVRLATRLSRQHPPNAMRQFAAEIDDPSGDLIASVLLLALTRSSRTSEMLSELAHTIRERAAMRLRVEADRSGQRSEARFVIGFSVTVVVGLLIFGRESEFLDAYDDGTGQLVFALVVGLFAYGIWWMVRLTKFDRPSRFLAIGETEDQP